MNDVVGKRAEEILWNPPPSLASGPGYTLVSVCRYLYALIRDIATGQLNLRAMSLVYTTLLSIVPLLAFSFSVLKGFGFHREVEPLLYQFLEPLGDKGIELTDQVIGFVDNVKGGLLGGIGLLVLVYTVVSMIQKIESAFNYIWHVERSRSLARRFSDYISVILVGPILMVAAMGMIASISSIALVREVSAIPSVGSTLVLAGKITPILLLSFVFGFVYAFVTNTRVSLSSAALGGISAGILWAVAGRLFAAFVVGSTRYAAIYTGFAVVIIALIWLYVGWLILLLGAQIAFYHQHPEYLKSGRRKVIPTGRKREALALELMVRVGRTFLKGPTTMDVNELAAVIGVPGTTLGGVAKSLQDSGLITKSEDGSLTPGRDLESTTLADVFSALRAPGDQEVLDTGKVNPGINLLLDEIDNVIAGNLSDRTIRDLIVDVESGEASVSGDSHLTDEH
ncbi:MAG: YihY/virulence factor BrkB family protein [Gammaproteobacteria bacterium]